MIDEGDVFCQYRFNVVSVINFSFYFIFLLSLQVKLSNIVLIQCNHLGSAGLGD